jgi:N-acetylglucosaminyl-diphospho-decaprenol L-rhamnosyltransferase
MKFSMWIVIVNYRTADLVVNCLNSLASQINELSGGRVLVIDNASGDGSVARLTSTINGEGWQEWASVLSLDHNGGFAFGNNAGIRIALNSPVGCDYLLLLNPDTLARPQAIKALIDFMDAHPEAGIAGSQLENAEGGEECSAHQFHSPLGELTEGASLGVLDRLLKNHLVTPPPKKDAHRCDWVSGASMIIRSEVFKDIGLLDEGYFLYYEEEDFCRRALLAGWEIWYVPLSRVMHLEGASTGIRAKAKRRATYWYDSRRRFYVKHYGVIGLAMADLLWTIGRTTLIFRRLIGLGGRKVRNDPAWFMPDLLWGDLKAFLTGQVWGIRRA